MVFIVLKKLVGLKNCKMHGQQEYKIIQKKSNSDYLPIDKKYLLDL